MQTTLDKMTDEAFGKAALRRAYGDPHFMTRQHWTDVQVVHVGDVRWAVCCQAIRDGGGESLDFFMYRSVDGEWGSASPAAKLLGNFGWAGFGAVSDFDADPLDARGNHPFKLCISPDKGRAVHQTGENLAFFASVVQFMSECIARRNAELAKAGRDEAKGKILSAVADLDNASTHQLLAMAERVG